MWWFLTKTNSVRILSAAILVSCHRLESFLPESFLRDDDHDDHDNVIMVWCWSPLAQVYAVLSFTEFHCVIFLTGAESAEWTQLQSFGPAWEARGQPGLRSGTAFCICSNVNVIGEFGEIVFYFLLEWNVSFFVGVIELFEFGLLFERMFSIDWQSLNFLHSAGGFRSPFAS